MGRGVKTRTLLLIQSPETSRGDKTAADPQLVKSRAGLDVCLPLQRSLCPHHPGNSLPLPASRPLVSRPLAWLKGTLKGTFFMGYLGAANQLSGHQRHRGFTCHLRRAQISCVCLIFSCPLVLSLHPFQMSLTRATPFGTSCPLLPPKAIPDAVALPSAPTPQLRDSQGSFVWLTSTTHCCALPG